MPTRRASNMALGLGNQTFPIWDLGADMYWRSANPTVVQTPGGTGTVSFSYTGATDQYYVYDIGRGHFRQVDPTGTPEFPPDGFVGPDRTNLWNDTQDSVRGFTTVDGSLTTSNPAVPSDHILDPTSTSLANLFRVENSSGGALRFSRFEGISTTINRIFSVLLKRTDGGVIDGSVATLFASSTAGGANEAGSTLYRQIREDGWYELSTVRVADGEFVNRFFGVELEDGFTVDVEMPGLEGSSLAPQQGAFPSPNTGAAGVGGAKGVFELSIARATAAGSTSESYSQSGWMACTIVHPYSTTDITLPFGVMANWVVDASNFLRLQVSGSEQHVAGEMDSGGASQFFLQVPGTPTIDVGDINGVVLAWGRRSNTDAALLCVNGQFIEVDTSWTLPIGTPSSIDIGFDSTTSGAEATVNIQEVVIGRGMLTRNDCRLLSLWMQQQGNNTPFV